MDIYNWIGIAILMVPVVWFAYKAWTHELFGVILRTILPGFVFVIIMFVALALALYGELVLEAFA
jgi:DMSO/TMAO reductase YedYZ heme-binding membrane subunit